MPRNLTLSSLDKNHVLLDVGLVLTKVGIVSEHAPRHIVPTPFSKVKKLRDSISELKVNTFAELFKCEHDHQPLEKTTTYLEVEEFLSQIFYHLLQVAPKDKGVVIVESFMGLRPLYETLGHCLFRSFGVRSVYYVLGNVLPIYSSGCDSGIIVDVGF
jgi:actin-related protein